MANFEAFINNYSALLHCVAQISIYTLELIGIFIIVIGSVRSIALLFSRLNSNKRSNIVINLGRSLALALEFKMGAEIINTVIVRDLKELLILAIVIAIRAILALLIHWEMKTEKETEESGD